MKRVGAFIIFILIAWISSCADEPETEAPWQFPREAITGTEIKTDSFPRLNLFLLYTVDGRYRDTLWFKPHDKPRWENLFTIQTPKSQDAYKEMNLSCPGEDGHLEIQSQSAIVGQSIKMQLSDSTQYTDFFRIIDRRFPDDSSAIAAIYQGVNVNLEVQGMRLYPLDIESEKYSGHIALTFSGLFQSRTREQLHEIEGFVGAL